MGAADVNANDEIRTELLNKLNTIESIQADFHQTTTTRDGNEEEAQTGRIAFLRPERFLWVVEKPYKEQVSIVGADMKVYDPDLQQLTHSKVDTDELSLANLLVDPESKALDNFEITRSGSKYVLTQKGDGALIAQLSLIFKDEAIERIELVDYSGTQIEFRFFNVRINEEVENDVFQLNVPPDTEVIGKGEPSNNLEP
ncbi:MAG: outer-membrane lipoprotein carrier protein LolA [Gammaproteobacteria bacterium]|nr:outer-membrane lipoprotein carrier protein LolA [Gammaproteobacteria bacterium]